MTIILFLVDTSASMNQRTFLGTTILDVTKNAIETFQKVNNKYFYIFIIFCWKIMISVGDIDIGFANILKLLFDF